jgi:hypothetical protein
MSVEGEQTMDWHELVNQAAPLLVQLMGILLLAAASGALLKLRQLLQASLTERQRQLLSDLASMAVHYAEIEGLGKAGAEKAAMARALVDSELRSRGIVSISAADLEAAVIGAVQRAWSYEIGPGGRASDPPEQPTASPVGPASAA